VIENKYFDDALKEVIKSKPFYSYIFGKTKKVYIEDMEFMAAMSIDSKTARPVMFVNKKMMSEIVDQMNITGGRNITEFIASIFLHELDHYVYGHLFKNPKSMYGQNAEIYNISTDAMINQYIPIADAAGSTAEDHIKGTVKEGKPFVSKSRDLSNPTSEELFAYLMELKDKKSGGSGGSGNQSGNNRGRLDDHSKFGVSPEAREIAEDYRNNLVKTAAEKSKGDIPGHLKDVVDDIFKSKINWKKVLKRFTGLGVRGGQRRSWKRENRRYEDMPGHVTDEEGKIGVILDTSGSMSDQDLKKAFTEIDALTKRQRKFFLVQYDAEVTSIDRYRPGSWKKIEVKGRGGTDMRPALEQMMEMRIRRIVSITDGYDCYNRDLLKSFKVLFLLTPNHDQGFESAALKDGFQCVVMD
jgi:predicted metal-dependent peptidase